MRYLLDTHTWYWWNSNSRMLSKRVLSLLEGTSRGDEFLLSAISVWEIAKLIERKRLHLSCSGSVWISQALDAPRLTLVPLTPEISWESTNLPGDLNKDPADQIIVATARLLDATLLTKDRNLAGYKHVRTLW